MLIKGQEDKPEAHLKRGNVKINATWIRLILDKTKTSFSAVVHYLITRKGKVISKRYF